MAKPKAQPAPARPAAATPRKRGGGGAKLSFLFLVILFAMVSPPTVVLLGIGLAPTFVAVIIDRDPDRSLTLTVGGLNFAGCVPFLLELWFESHRLSDAFVMLGEVIPLLTIYGAAGLGWGLFLGTPGLVTSYMRMTSGRRISDLRREQLNLVEEWGPEVSQAGDSG